jgi:WD40 repeat protein
VKLSEAFDGRRASDRWPRAIVRRISALAALCFFLFAAFPAQSQVEMAESPPQPPTWVAHGSAEGHLATTYSPAGAFSPDSSLVAVVNGDAVALMELSSQGVAQVVHPRLPDLVNLDIESANFLAPSQLFILCTGEIVSRSKKNARRTPELAIQWDIQKNALVGKVHALDAAGKYSAPQWFPQIHYLGMSRQNTFELWNPVTGKGGVVTVPPLTRPAHLFTFSPDGRWLLLAQIESSSLPDPIVVGRPGEQFENTLRGHSGTVECMEFSHDGSRVVTASIDGKVRIYSTSDWKLQHTLAGHDGAVHWAEFSPNGQWVVSAGEDKTVRVWSAETGELLQTLRESKEPVLTVAFSPDSQFIAASAAKKVLVWHLSAGISLR